jgi:predicted RNase H-like nuclease
MPYEVLAGVEPCNGGWLVVSGRLVGTTLAYQPPQVFTTFRDLIDWKPAFQIIAVNAPLGFPASPARGGRQCDHEARRMLGRHHWHAVPSAPTRAALNADTFDDAVLVDPHLTRQAWTYASQVREVADEMAPYWQRTLFEVNPELSFYALNKCKPLNYTRGTRQGFSERCWLLEDAMPGLDEVFAGCDSLPATTRQIIGACANLWSARRIRAHAAVRVPADPDWDDLGIRMEIWH